MAKQTTVFVPQGYSLSFTTDAFTSGYYVRLDVPGGTKYTPATMAVSTAYTIGPFNEGRDYRFDYAGNDLVFSYTPSGVFTGQDEVDYVSTSDDVTALAPLNETNIPEVTDSGELLAVPDTIAAVNGILAILVAAGLMAAPEEA